MNEADWQEANQRYLVAHLARIHEALQRYAGREAAAEPEVELSEARAALPAPAALDRITTGFALSEFERDVLLLCAGVELDGALAELCRRSAHVRACACCPPRGALERARARTAPSVVGDSSRPCPASA